MTTPLAAWGLPRPDAVRPVHGGTNNTTRIVDLGGTSYVLRIYQNLSADRVAAEHHLVEALAGAGLSFAVPVPIPTVDGRTFVPTTDGVAALFPFLDGRLPHGDDLAELETAGEALAELDVALAGLPSALAPVDWRRPLHEIHPAVPDLADLGAELARELPDEPGVGWLRDAAGPAEEAYAGLLDRLPVQIVHGDFALSNVLVTDDAVTAVLDFEVAGLDLRVTDLVAGLHQATDGAAQAAAFRRGYARRVELSREEEDAIPDLLRLRALGNVIWRAGRRRLGQAGLDEVRSRLAAGLALEQQLCGRA